MKILLLSALLSFSSFAEVFQMRGELVEFKNVDGLLLNGCEKGCDALKTVAKFKKIDLKKSRARQSFKGSIGSDVCRLVYQAGSVFGSTQDKDQRAFCVFHDNSLIEINSLSLYLTQKKIVTEE